LITSITLPTGWLLFRRKISWSFASIAVRFFSLGVYCGRHVPFREWIRNYFKFLTVKSNSLLCA
jgi:hypothetical protein